MVNILKATKFFRASLNLFHLVRTVSYQWLLTRYHQGYYIQDIAGSQIYLATRSDFVAEHQVQLVCKKYFFKAYEPSEGDTIVDIGASFGHEIALIRNRLGDSVRYFAIEPQPKVFDCLANSLQRFGDNYVALITPISSVNEDFRIGGGMSISIPVSRLGTGARIPTITFKEFLQKYQIDEIDFCKINIEGEERTEVDQFCETGSWES